MILEEKNKKLSCVSGEAVVQKGTTHFLAKKESLSHYSVDLDS